MFFIFNPPVRAIISISESSLSFSYFICVKHDPRGSLLPDNSNRDCLYFLGWIVIVCLRAPDQLI